MTPTTPAEPTAPLSSPTISAPSGRGSSPDGGVELLLQQRVAGEHQPDDRRDEQQHRDQAEEHEVGDSGGHEVALVRW
jgi:hypothetical protein